MGLKYLKMIGKILKRNHYKQCWWKFRLIYILQSIFLFLLQRIKGSHTENVFMRALEIVVDDIQEGSLIWLNILMMLIALTFCA